ncbi:hypothetical protein [Nocardioides sp. AX2bis]|nr:hypothetical protein [Nocardioides sp. AX2bis]VXC20595.1 conserved hypothetical protein [Nocardioides sp. AX2bis]
MGFLIVVLVLVAAFAAYKYRVPLMAKVLGQSETRVRSQIERKKRR